jgi:hypothetical protein
MFCGQPTKESLPYPYKRHISPGLLDRVVGQLEECVRAQKARVDAGTIDTQELAAQLRRDLRACIASAIFGRVASSRDNLVTTAALDIKREVVEAVITERLRTSPIVTQQEQQVITYDAARAVSLVEQVSQPMPLPPGAKMVERVLGWAIRPRGDPSREQAATRAMDGGNFSVPVPGPSAPFDVRMQGGIYRLVLLDETGAELEVHQLPDALTASVPEGLAKADTLRSQLEIAELVERRPATAAEAALDVERVVEGPGVFAESILARSEYRLKPDGGSRGPLLLADLLRRSDGSYRVPRTPALIVGAQVEILGSMVRMAGLIAGDGVLLHGYHEFEIEAVGHTLQLQGELNLVASALWQSLPAGLTRDALRFRGFTEFRRGADVLFRGAAEGLVSMAGGRPTLALDVTMHLQSGFEVGVGDTKLTKLTWDNDARLKLRYSDGAFSFEGQADLSVECWAATPALVEVEVSPARTVCVPVPRMPPVPPEWHDECVNLPAVVATVPDPTRMVWSQLFTLGARLHVALTDGRFLAELQVEAHPPELPAVTILLPKL